MVIKSSNPFGSRTRNRTLLALRLLEESHARELSRVLQCSLQGVQGALRSLERDGLIAARSVGRTRLFRLDPRYFAARELATFLARLLEPDDQLRRATSGLRRRPRRAGKRG